VIILIRKLIKILSLKLGVDRCLHLIFYFRKDLIMAKKVKKDGKKGKPATKKEKPVVKKEK
jgi:hypothetical protein